MLIRNATPAEMHQVGQIRLAADLGIIHLVLLTTPDMRAAHRLYERAGFVRLPGRD